MEIGEERDFVIVNGNFDFFGAAGFYRGQRRTRMKWQRFEMQSEQGQATVEGFSITRRMELLFGIFSLLLLSKMTLERPLNLLGTHSFPLFHLLLVVYM